MSISAWMTAADCVLGGVCLNCMSVVLCVVLIFSILLLQKNAARVSFFHFFFSAEDGQRRPAPLCEKDVLPHSPRPSFADTVFAAEAFHISSVINSEVASFDNECFWRGRLSFKTEAHVPQRVNAGLRLTVHSGSMCPAVIGVFNITSRRNYYIAPCHYTPVITLLKTCVSFRRVIARSSYCSMLAYYRLGPWYEEKSLGLSKCSI